MKNSIDIDIKHCENLSEGGGKRQKGRKQEEKKRLPYETSPRDLPSK